MFCYLCTIRIPLPLSSSCLPICSTDIVETKNLTLEETAALFDGDDAKDNIAGATAPISGNHGDLKHDDISADEKLEHHDNEHVDNKL